MSLFNRVMIVGSQGAGRLVRVRALVPLCACALASVSIGAQAAPFDGAMTGTYACGKNADVKARAVDGFSSPFAIAVTDSVVTGSPAASKSIEAFSGSIGQNGEADIKLLGHWMDTPSREWVVRFAGSVANASGEITGVMYAPGGAAVRSCTLRYSMQRASDSAVSAKPLGAPNASPPEAPRVATQPPARLEAVERTSLVAPTAPRQVSLAAAIASNSAPAPGAPSAWGKVPPCMSKVCLGDSVFALLDSVKWVSKPASPAPQKKDRAKPSDIVVSNPNEPFDRPSPEVGFAKKWLTNYSRGLSADDLETLAQYIAGESFDRRALAILAKPGVSMCRNLTITGGFRSESGYATLVAGTWQTGHRFVVTRLRRIFDAEDKIAIDTLRAQVKVDFPYVSFDRPSREPPPWGPGEAIFTGNGSFGHPPQLTFDTALLETKDGDLAAQAECAVKRLQLN